MAHLLFVSVPSVLPKNRENYPPRYAHDLAVGPAAHLLDMVISCFSAKLGFQANYVRSEREPLLCDILVQLVLVLDIVYTG